METLITNLEKHQEQPMAIGPWIKRCREQKGMPLKTLSAKVGCAQTTLESIERQYPMRKGEPPYQPAAKLMQAILDELDLHITLEELARVTDWKGLEKRKGSFGWNAPKVNGVKRKKKESSEPNQTRKQYHKEPLKLVDHVKGMKEYLRNKPTQYKAGFVEDLMKENQALKADLTMYQKIDVQQLNEENLALKQYIRELLLKDLDSLIEEQIDSIAKGASFKGGKNT